LRVEDLTEVPDRFRVLNRRSKTDQTGERQEIVIPRGAKIRPVQTVQEWLLAAGITEGLLFRVVWRGGHVKPRALRGADVAVIVKRVALAAGLDPVEFSGHSWRAPGSRRRGRRPGRRCWRPWRRPGTSRSTSSLPTCAVGPDGDVYQNDLGPETAGIAARINDIPPGPYMVTCCGDERVTALATP
jgi:hypothetical protein